MDMISKRKHALVLASDLTKKKIDAGSKKFLRGGQKYTAHNKEYLEKIS